VRREQIVETIVETHEYVVVRRRAGASADGWCAVCARAAQFVTPPAAAVMAATSTREIYRRIEAGLLHGAETPDRNFLICLHGLLG
jgi:hypothetical protein